MEAWHGVGTVLYCVFVWYGVRCCMDSCYPAYPSAWAGPTWDSQCRINCIVKTVQIQKHKYTNTQTCKYTNTAYDEVPERPNMQYILKKRIVQGYQKLYSHVSNAQMQSKVPERPNMWYIFEKAIVQGCLLSLAQLYKVYFSFVFRSAMPCK